MKIEEREYSKEQFKSYLLEYAKEIFDVGNQRRTWLKIYSLLVADDSWKKSLFNEEEIQQLGEIFKAKLIDTSELGEEKTTVYYICTRFIN